MARVYETVRVYERRQLAVKCDLCGCRSPQPHGWAPGPYDVSEVKVAYRWGKQYPEDSYGSQLAVDLCPTCFRGRLLVWLREQGAVVEEEEWGD